MLDFSINLPAPMEKLMQLSEDYKNLSKYLPDQLKSVKILEQSDNQTITEEKIVLSTIIKKEIIQQAVHKKNSDNELITEIILGPAKGTVINTIFTKTDSGTNVTFKIDLKLEFKAKILQPLIKKY